VRQVNHPINQPASESAMRFMDGVYLMTPKQWTPEEWATIMGMTADLKAQIIHDCIVVTIPTVSGKHIV